MITGPRIQQKGFLCFCHQKGLVKEHVQSLSHFVYTTAAFQLRGGLEKQRAGEPHAAALTLFQVMAGSGSP